MTGCAYAVGRGPGCEVSDAGGGNVEDEGEAIDEREPDQHFQTIPVYGVDQSLGAINSDLAERRERLAEQLSDLKRSGCHELARQTKEQLDRLDTSTSSILAQRGAV
ncbi:MAG: hypothetical protein QM605_15355 [Sphingobium sp.]